MFLIHVYPPHGIHGALCIGIYSVHDPTPVGIFNPSSALGHPRLCTIHSHLMSPCLARRKYSVCMWRGRCTERKPLMASLLGRVFHASFKANLRAKLEVWIYTFHMIRKRQQRITEQEKSIRWQYSIPSGPFWTESFIHFWSCHAACQIWTLQLGIEPIPLAVQARSPKPWAARESPCI